MSKIRLAIVGLGNCANSLIQGIGYYSFQSESKRINGVMHKDICGYEIRDIEVVAAIDVNANKVGKDIADAMWVEPNCTKEFYTTKKTGVKVEYGPTLDGISCRMLDKIDLYEKENSYEHVEEVLKEAKPDILVSYLPVGSDSATEFYAELCLKLGIGFINAIPSFICSTKDWAGKFKQKGIPCSGDDIKSQVGATIIHRVLTALIDDRGHAIESTYQLNIGGNSDFENMLDEERLTSKRISKTEAVTSQTDQGFDVKIGPSDYIPHLKDNKICYINLKGTQFGDIPFELDLKLSVEDSPNSAGCMIDVIRLMKVALDRGDSGYMEFSGYFFKHPMNQYRDSEAKEIVDLYINYQKNET